MKITDKNVLDYLKQINSTELRESILYYPEDEVGDKTEMEVFIECLDWLLYKYNCDSYVQYYVLKDAIDIVMKTENGTVIPMDIDTFEPTFEKEEIENAINIVEFSNTLNDVYEKVVGKKYKFWG